MCLWRDDDDDEPVCLLSLSSSGSSSSSNITTSGSDSRAIAVEDVVYVSEEIAGDINLFKQCEIYTVKLFIRNAK